jgi:probable F420-dependent oxidoreductase
VELKIGLGLFTGQLPSGSGRTFEQEYRETLELVRLGEELGFDSAWVSEHHGSSDGYLPSLLPMLAAMAARTERIELGTAVVLAPFHDPLRLAEDVAVVDQISGGRVLLGLGVAWREEEFRMFGVPRRERGVRTEELVEICRRAWTGERFSFEGRVFRLDRVKVTPAPARAGGVPIYLGGYEERAVRRAGRIADGYVTDASPVDEVRGAVAYLEAGAHDAGRDPSQLELALMQNAFVVRDGNAVDLVRAGVSHQLGAYDAWDAGHDTPEHDALEPSLLSDEEVVSSTAVGTPDEVASRLRTLIADLGRERPHLIVRLHYPGMNLSTAARAVELFAAEVIPALRA